MKPGRVDQHDLLDHISVGTPIEEVLEVRCWGAAIDQVSSGEDSLHEIPRPHSGGTAQAAFIEDFAGQGVRRHPGLPELQEAQGLSDSSLPLRQFCRVDAHIWFGFILQ